MATRSKNRNGLEQAVSLLVHAQAELVQNQAAFQSQLIAMNERFARIESKLHEIKSILLRHEEAISDLQEAVSNLPEVIARKSASKPATGSHGMLSMPWARSDSFRQKTHGIPPRGTVATARGARGRPDNNHWRGPARRACQRVG